MNIAPSRGSIDPREEALAQQFFDEEIGTEEFLREIDAPAAEAEVVSAAVQSPGGQIVVYLRFEGPRQTRIREALVTGDFFITPPRVIFDLEASLRGVERARAKETVMAFFARQHIGLLSARPEDFAEAVGLAAERDVRNASVPIAAP